VITSFDPNIRPSLIKNRKSYLDMFYKISETVDVLKMSDDDLEYITGSKEVEEILRKILGKANRLTFVTLGKNGAVGYYKGQFVQVPAFNKIRVKETTGCGDSFMAAIIFRLLNSGDLATISQLELIDILTFANAAAAITATRYGASTSMPTLSEVKQFISHY